MLVSVKDIKKKYRLNNNEVDVLRGIDFEINKGEIVAVTGKSGSGKTTMLNIIGTLDRPDSGIVEFLDEDISKYSDKKLAKFRNENIGFVFQFHYLLPEFDALENVMMPALVMGKNEKEAEERAKELLEKVGLGERLYHRSSELSGGEQQRVAFARALMNSPKLLLADEPTGNLDSKTSEELFNIMWNISRETETAFIVVTHDPMAANKADRHLTITDGVIV